ncbi:hypothetical protein STEG23_025354 [Scotinomys teguina]
MGREFGKLTRMRHVISYSLSPFEQRAFPNYFSKGIPNVLRRTRERILRVAPLLMTCLLLLSQVRKEIYVYVGHGNGSGIQSDSAQRNAVKTPTTMQQRVGTSPPEVDKPFSLQVNGSPVPELSSAKRFRRMTPFWRGVSLRPIGASCRDDSECITRLCSNSRCAILLKKKSVCLSNWDVKMDGICSPHPRRI